MNKGATTHLQPRDHKYEPNWIRVELLIAWRKLRGILMETQPSLAAPPPQPQNYKQLLLSHLDNQQRWVC